jgi:hypothetical protein
MRSALIWTTALWTALAGAATAQEAPAPIVVELFTSQGCSSCPPADALLGELGEREDVIALALHVDYWDYIGWKDKFAQRKFTRRQKGYAHSGGWRQIYTPQMVINGAEDVVGSRPMKVANALQRQSGRTTPVQLEISRDGDVLTVSAQTSAQIGPSDIHIVRYTPEQDVAIKRGENAGRTISYTHIVQDWERAAQWSRGDKFERRFNVSGDEPIVVLVQEENYGAVLAASRLR